MKPEDAPRVSALIDQAAAAARQGQGFLAGFLKEKGGRIEADLKLTGPVALVVARYDGLSVSGQLTGCAHLAAGPFHGTQPMFWVPWKADLVLCQKCQIEANKAIEGTEEDRTCDACGLVEEEGFVYSIAVQRPAIVLAAPFFLAAGPVTMHFGLCRSCRALSEPGGEFHDD